MVWVWLQECSGPSRGQGPHRGGFFFNHTNCGPRKPKPTKCHLNPATEDQKPRGPDMDPEFQPPAPSGDRCTLARRLQRNQDMMGIDKQRHISPQGHILPLCKQLLGSLGSKIWAPTWAVAATVVGLLPGR